MYCIGNWSDNFTSFSDVTPGEPQGETDCCGFGVYSDTTNMRVHIQGGPKVGIQLLKVGFGSKSRFVVLM